MNRSLAGFIIPLSAVFIALLIGAVMLVSLGANPVSGYATDWIGS